MFALVAAVAISAALYSRYYIENSLISSFVSTYNEDMADVISGTIWQKFERSTAKCLNDNKTPEECDFTEELKSEISDIFRRFKFLEYEIYMEKGDSLFGGVRDTKELELFGKALAGETNNEIIYDYAVGSRKHNVIRSFIPIIPDVSSPERRKRIPAVIELVYDITPVFSKPLVWQAAAVIFVMVIFGAAFGFMLYAMAKTERLITKQYETNVDLVSAKTTAEKESREKSQFLANISHELRTPLNAIIGFSEILKDEVMGPINNPQYKEYVNDINLSGVHLLSLINDILDFSKAEAGKLKVELADVDVTKVMTNSIKLVTPTANDSGVKLIEEIPKEHYILKTDGKRLKQVILNLLSNAVKFTPSGGTVKLYAWVSVAENKFVIEVKDTGVGIDPKDISKAMTTFGQVENKLSRKHEGTGLGLPLSRKLVELMGGKLEITSKPGVGTTVSIVLPYQVSETGYDTNQIL